MGRKPTAISSLTSSDKVKRSVVVAKDKPIDKAKYIRNMLDTSLIIQTVDTPPIRGKKGRIRSPGVQYPDIVLAPYEKISNEKDAKRYETIMKDISGDGRGRQHAVVLRSRGMLSFPD